MSKKRFIYHGYLQIVELDAAVATETAMPVLRKTYLWDPLEPVATRILAMSLFDETGTWAEDLYCTHDLLKNATALFGIRAGRRALYEYGPYGNIVRMEGNAAEDNLFRFSSEYADDELGLVYYNYRYYNVLDGRWINRDNINIMYPYTYIQNQITRNIDYIGFISQDAIGPTDYDLEGPPPGKKKCYGFLEQSPKKTIERVQKEQVDKLQSIIEKANRITDKLGRRCYLIMLKSEPLNNDAIKSLPGMSDRAILLAHTNRKPGGGFFLTSGGKRIDDSELDLRRVDVFGCHRGDRGRTTQSANIEYAIERISKLEKKDCCNKVESLVIVTGTEAGYLY